MMRSEVMMRSDEVGVDNTTQQHTQREMRREVVMRRSDNEMRRSDEEGVEDTTQQHTSREKEGVMMRRSDEANTTTRRREKELVMIRRE